MSPSQQTQNICIPFVQCWTSVEDVMPTLYKWYTNVLCLLGYNTLPMVIQESKFNYTSFKAGRSSRERLQTNTTTKTNCCHNMRISSQLIIHQVPMKPQCIFAFSDKLNRANFSKYMHIRHCSPDLIINIIYSCELPNVIIQHWEGM